jgi:transposase-like protein
VDQDDNVLDILVQSRRNKKAAKKFFKKYRQEMRNRFESWAVITGTKRAA